MGTKTWIGIATMAIFTVCGTIAASAQQPKQPAAHFSRLAVTAVADDSMTPYRNLADETLKAFKASNMTLARKKAKELETAWDKHENDLKKKSPDIWNQIDKAMDDFIKPMQDKAPNAEKVQKAYDAFVAKLQLAAK